VPGVKPGVMKKTTTRLALRSTTLRHLSGDDLSAAVGGAATALCPATATRSAQCPSVGCTTVK